ncbi:MAG: 30S ribosomal protein S1 [Dehalococcoidia bacterium]
MNVSDQHSPRNDDPQSAPSMQQLLDEVEGYKILRRGDIVSGVVVRKDREGMLVDVGAKTEGVIPSREMRSLDPQELEGIEAGDDVLAYVLQTEDKEDQIVLSIDRAQGEKGWHTLQKYYENGDVIEGQAVDFNKGGLLVNIEGVRGFVPMSQLTGVSFNSNTEDPTTSPLAQLVGKALRLKVIEINRRRNRLILSEKQVLREEREQLREKLLNEIREGEVRKGRVTGIREFGAFVDIGGVDGLVHLSEFSWGHSEPPEKCLNIGDEVETYILKVDREAKKIALSFRRLHPEPWETIHEKYHVDQIVTGTITKVTSFGAFARLDSSIEGLVHVSELSDTPASHPEDVVKEGDVLTLKILRIEPERRRLALSLRQAQAIVEEDQGGDSADSEETQPEEAPPTDEVGPVDEEEEGNEQ